MDLKVNIWFSISLKIYISSCPSSTVLNIGGKAEKKKAFSCSVKKLFLRDEERNVFYSAKYGNFEHIQRNDQINPETYLCLLGRESVSVKC